MWEFASDTILYARKMQRLVELRGRATSARGDSDTQKIFMSAI